MTTLFISDLHLSQDRPAITNLFIDFLSQQARDTEALYILGDLFEVWLGDDMVLPVYKEAIASIKSLSDSGVPVYIMYGNRDFLMRDAFEKMSGAKIIDEPSTVNLYGNKMLLMHGDTLCTDDIEYQKFRSMVRNPQWQNDLLAKSPEERTALAQHLREVSKAETSKKKNDIMDVNQQAVASTMQENKVLHLIHGHTHRPAFHKLRINGKDAERIVLGDWYSSGNYLACNEHGCEYIELN